MPTRDLGSRVGLSDADLNGSTLTLRQEPTVNGAGTPWEATPSEPPSCDQAAAATDAAVGVAVILSLGALMLRAGSPTDDVERAMRSTAVAIGLRGATAVVSFGAISLSYSPGPAAQPVTAVRLITERTTDFRRLTAAAALVGQLTAGAIDMRGAAAEIRRIENLSRGRAGPLMGRAQAACAGASALLFGGSAIDALAAFLVSAGLLLIVGRLDRSGLPPFFRSLIGPLVLALFVAAALAFEPPINPVPVLAGSLLPFLPGAALVAGMRDLIDQSIVSGMARLTEALLLAAAVAAGTAIGMDVASHIDVALGIGIGSPQALTLPTQVVVAAIVSGTWAVRLGNTRVAVLVAGALGALGWFAFATAVSLGSGIVAATAFAGLALGVGGRILARRADALVVHWVVPASLPLLPGLAIVYGMLAADAAVGLTQLGTAVATALALGGAIAFGDILTRSIWQVPHRLRLTEPATV